MLFNRSLGLGGAERQLVMMACAMQARGLPVAVTVLYGGPLRAELDAAGVQVFDLAKSGRWDVSVLPRLLHVIRLWRPGALYCFGGSMLFAALLRPWLRQVRVIWGIRASVLDFSFYGRVSRLLLRLDPLLARAADLVICNSKAGRDHVVSRGFPVDRVKVVLNGIDTDRWQFTEEGRRRMRDLWGIGAAERLVGIVGRLDPIKDHASFLHAAALCRATDPDLRFVVIGSGDAAYSKWLVDLALSLAPDLVVWAGNCSGDMEAAYSALDVLTLTSLSEGFPNVIGEGMACGLPVVSTDVGDARDIVGEFGAIVPVGDRHAIAAGMLATLAAQDARRNMDIRDHIARHFSLDVLLAQTLRLAKGDAL